VNVKELHGFLTVHLEYNGDADVIVSGGLSDPDREIVEAEVYTDGPGADLIILSLGDEV
jgi:hypothetical protein